MSKIKRTFTLTKQNSKGKIAVVGKKPIKDPGVVYKRLTIEIPEDLHKSIKIYCIEHNQQINEFLIPLIKKALPKYKDENKE